MTLLKIFDDKDGNGGGQMKSDDLRTMTTIGQRTLIMLTVNSLFDICAYTCILSKSLCFSDDLTGRPSVSIM